MKRTNQKVVLQDNFSGLHLENVRRAVREIEDYGEYWTGKATINGREYDVKLQSIPGKIDTWYTL